MINNFIDAWYAVLWPMTYENSLFLVFIFFSLFLFRNKEARVSKGILLIGFLKLAVPPFWEIKHSLPLFTPLSITPNNNLLIKGVLPGISAPGVPYLFLFWVGAILILMALLLGKHFLLRHKLKNGIGIGYFDDGKIPVIQTRHSHFPFTIGIFKPRIIVPVFWPQLTPAQQKTVLTHEMQHIHQHDTALFSITLFVTILHFYNPLAWLLFSRLREFSEKSCDDSTIARLDRSPISYLKELVAILEYIPKGNKGLIPMANFAGIYTKNKKRFAYQLKRKERPMRQKYVLALWGSMALLFFAACSTRGLVEKDNPKTVDGYYKFFMLDKKPAMLKKIPAKYPEEARTNKIEGRVIIQVFIDETGRVVKTTVLRKVDKLLDEAALAAAQKLIFTPAHYKGKNVKSMMAIPYLFKLKPKKK